MRRIKIVALGSVFLGLGACSSASPTEPSGVGSGAAATSSSTSGKTIAYFEGSVDVAHGTMDVVTGSPGALTPQATLPYGPANGDLYFHTCSTSFTGGTYGGGVTAINVATGTSTDTNVNAVIDSISESGVTLATGSGTGGTSGVIASYGTVVSGALNCTGPTTWTFNLPGSANFNFIGHATGYLDGLVAAWAVNEGSGTTFNDSSGNGQTATTSGGSWQTGGYDGPAVTNAALPVTATGVTISVFAERTGSGSSGYPRIISYDNASVNGLEIADYANSGVLGVYNGSSWFDTGVSFPPGAFLHIVVTASSSAMLVYVGGSLSNSYAGDPTDFTGLSLYFGQRGQLPGSEEFGGIYDDVRVFNRVLSATEVAALP